MKNTERIDVMPNKRGADRKRDIVRVIREETAVFCDSDSSGCLIQTKYSGRFLHCVVRLLLTKSN